MLALKGGRGVGLFAGMLADFQKRDFAALDPAFQALRHRQRPACQRFWIERTKGASKDTDLATLLLWVLAFTPNQLACQVAAADAEQADELRRAADAIVRLNPWLAELVDVQRDALVNPHTGSRAKVLTLDALGSHGACPDLLILNELTHAKGDAGREFALTLLDNASKAPNGVVIIATNAGFLDSWQHQLRETYRASPRWYFAAVTDPAPWLDPAELAEAEKRNPPSRFRRLWRGEWVSGSGDAIDADDIQAAIRQPGPMVGTEPGWGFYAGLDIGVKHDRAALAVVGQYAGATLPVEAPAPERPRVGIWAALEDLGLIDPPAIPERVRISEPAAQRLRLADCRGWTPSPGRPVSLMEVEEAVWEAWERFRFAACWFDPSQALLMAERLRVRGVPMVETPFSGGNLSDMAARLLEAFKARELELYPDAELLADINKLRLVERSFGVKLEAARDGSGHADRAIALALAVLGARRCPVVGTAPDGEPLVIY